MKTKYDVNVSDLTFEQLKKIRRFLKHMVEQGGSDLHIKSGSVIRGRFDGSLKKLSETPLSRRDSITLAKELLKSRYPEFVENKEIDLVYSFDEFSRFRVNMFFQIDGVSAVFRVIPMNIPSFEDLKLPEILRSFTQKERGLVLITGVTGSGKSTTLASLINEINLKYRKHIITIEDPVEFVHKDKGCIINQRSVGQDTLSFKNALRAALREDPDIILVGEMRDIETINPALHAADTGHLVFATLHTIDAKETINRIIAQFPIEEQPRVRLSLASVIQGIVSQRLIPTLDNNRVAAVEVLVKTPTIEKLISENRDFEIVTAIANGSAHYKSQTFDQCIFNLYDKKIISKKEALLNATSSANMELRMSGLSSGNNNEETSKTEYDLQETDSDVFELK